MEDFKSPLRKKADRLYRTYRAIRILTGSLAKEDRERVDKSVAMVARLPKRQLQEEIPKLEKEVRRLSKFLGLRVPLETLEEIIEPPNPSFPLLYLNKVYLQQIFASYEHLLSDLSDFPPHARIGIDLVSETSKVEVLLLDATLYEDMASLWNLTLATAQPYEQNNDKQPFKRTLALTRATAKAAFNFVEGYLNGLATDILVMEVVSEQDKTKLSEWDDEARRIRFLSLRDKLLQYPKIAVNASHPLLDEGNCPEIKLIINLEKEIRHSLIHPTPMFDSRRLEHCREEAHSQLQMGIVAELCDCAVGLVVKLNAAIGEKYGKVDHWLYPRNAEGEFPPEAFT